MGAATSRGSLGMSWVSVFWLPSVWSVMLIWHTTKVGRANGNELSAETQDAECRWWRSAVAIGG